MHSLGVSLLKPGRSSKAHRIRDGVNVVDAESVRVTLSMTVAERDVKSQALEEMGQRIPATTFARIKYEMKRAIGFWF